MTTRSNQPDNSKTSKNEFGIIDNDQATTNRLLGLNKRAMSPIRVAILAKFNAKKVNESFTVPTPPTTEGATPAKKDATFAKSVRSLLTSKAKQDGKGIFTHEEDPSIAEGTISIVKTVKQAPRSPRQSRSAPNSDNA